MTYTTSKKHTVASLASDTAQTVTADVLVSFAMSMSEYQEAYGQAVIAGDDGDTGNEGDGSDSA